jgi:hypothetical protein
MPNPSGWPSAATACCDGCGDALTGGRAVGTEPGPDGPRRRTRCMRCYAAALALQEAADAA